jgi:carbon monoxide dehydrogenase subunit G
MSTIVKEIMIDAPPAKAWDALRDFGAVHTRLVPGFVTACRMDGDARVVTFGNGMTIRERLVGIDEKTRRVAYSAVSELATHHNASAQIVTAGENRTRFIWITDVLPNDAATSIEKMMDQGAAVIKKTLEQAS